MMNIDIKYIETCWYRVISLHAGNRNCQL